MDFRNKTADLQVTVRHLSRPHHLDADLFSLTSYGPLASDRNCAFTDCSGECVQRGAQITGPSPHNPVLPIPYLGGRRAVPIRSGAQRLIVMYGREFKRNGRPRGSPAPSPCVWRAVSRHPVLGALTVGSRPRNPAHRPHNGTLADRFRRATTKSAVHKVVP